MTLSEKRAFTEAFWRKAGRNMLTALSMIDAIPGAACYVKDCKGRFVAANRRNLDICGIAKEEDVIGLTSADVFPAPLARAYTELDRRVRETGEPVVRTTESPTGDFSSDRLEKSVYPVWSGKRCIGTVGVYMQTPASGAMPEWHGRLRETTAWIAENPGAPLSVKSISERAGMVPKSLEAAFKAVLGTSVAGFVAAQRLAAARKKLETTDATISAIAQECGFCDHSHFAKAFRARWGLPPGAYRKSFRRKRLCRR